MFSLASSKPTLTWDPGPVKTMVLNNLVSNGEIVGEFVESDARKRLLMIGDPSWGRAYRREVVARLLDNEVKKGKNEVVISVGVRKSRSGSHHGFYIELGSATAPPHPFLRPAVFQNGKDIVAILQGQ